jgi:hypothetical protein
MESFGAETVRSTTRAHGHTPVTLTGLQRRACQRGDHVYPLHISTHIPSPRHQSRPFTPPASSPHTNTYMRPFRSFSAGPPAGNTRVTPLRTPTHIHLADATHVCWFYLTCLYTCQHTSRLAQSGSFDAGPHATRITHVQNAMHALHVISAPISQSRWFGARAI